VAIGFAAGCGLKIEEEERQNEPPTTIFQIPPANAPRDTIFQNERFFEWLGTDEDSDVVASQYQLVEVDFDYFDSEGQSGEVLRLVAPPRSPIDCPSESEACWSDRATVHSETFRDLPDGWYEMRARVIDDGGLPDESPETHLFYVFFDDIKPCAVLGTTDNNWDSAACGPPGSNNQGCGRLEGRQAHTFLINATDLSRNATTERRFLEYRVQLRAQVGSPCATHLADSFTEWTPFPDNTNTPIVIGDAPPTQYTDLISPNCVWVFTLQVRDPAGNRGDASCEIVQR
jgi:hypothetical protein